MAAPAMRIGLLGGSFNPPHEAHREISLTALRRLGLDQVWWLVSPANPLKDAAKLPSLEARVEAARSMARHPRIEVTGFTGGCDTAQRRMNSISVGSNPGSAAACVRDLRHSKTDLIQELST